MGSLLSVPAAAASEEGESAVVAVHSAGEWTQNWQAHSQTNKLMVIDFSASWCGPCRMIEPVFREMSNQYTDAVFLKIDVDELPEVSKQWKVLAMPTFLLVKGGKEVGRIVGVQKDKLEMQIKELLNA
ncbi:thioredoxin H2-1-like [Zingiber officinale]|uniref:thioredoxin H2-1-like n=1 Tax=Zingiber officinale TaxID=94328 RepID=UPI001C4CEDE8|nr:thioredoxin H2-1-like [Zingiber officinale]